MFASFGPFGLSFGETLFFGALLVTWACMEAAKKAASSPAVQKGATNWLVNLFK